MLKRSSAFLKTLYATATCIALFVVAKLVARNVHFPPLTHTILLLSSLGLAAVLSRGDLSAFGLTKGRFHFHPRLLLWACPMAVPATIQAITLRHASSVPMPEIGPQSPLAVVLLVWVYSSVCEEVFTRGLYQSWLSELREYKFRVYHQFYLRTPVLLSALLFGGMHSVLWAKMGPRALLVMMMAAFLGIVAGYYRDKTGSVLPAILIHALFNVGGTLPIWILRILHR